MSEFHSIPNSAPAPDLASPSTFSDGLKLVGARLILELKAADALGSIHTAQVMSHRDVSSPLGALGVLAVEFPSLHASRWRIRIQVDSLSGKGRPHEMNRQDAKDAKEIESLDVHWV